MKYLAVMLLVFGLVHSASLSTLNMEIENSCDETDEIVIVTVTSSSGKGIEGAYIKVEDIDPWKSKTSGVANEDGVFEFEGCGDTWNITASYGGYETKTETFTLGACNSCTSAPPPEPEPPEPPEEPTENETAPTPPDPPAEPTPEPPAQDTTPPPADSGNTVTPPPEETEEEETEKPGKRPLPCCASSAILFAVAGFVIKARK
jgi:hypothetical protein